MYTLSDRRAIDMIEENGELIVVISDLNSDNFIEFPVDRWKSFLLLQADIDDAVRQIENTRHFKYLRPFGDGWHVSVRRCFLYVDIRRYDSMNKPTNQGLTLSIAEWKTLLKRIPFLVSIERIFSPHVREHLENNNDVDQVY